MGEKKIIKIYTDGSNVENDLIIPKSGWAFVIPDLNIQQSGALFGESNIFRAEVIAVIKALEFIVAHPGDYHIYSDNLAVVDSFKGNTPRKGYKDLWALAYQCIVQIAASQSTFRISFMDKRVSKKHASYAYITKADSLAYSCANDLQVV